VRRAPCLGRKPKHAPSPPINSGEEWRNSLAEGDLSAKEGAQAELASTEGNLRRHWTGGSDSETEGSRLRSGGGKIGRKEFWAEAKEKKSFFKRTCKRKR